MSSNNSSTCNGGRYKQIINDLCGILRVYYPNIKLETGADEYVIYYDLQHTICSNDSNYNISSSKFEPIDDKIILPKIRIKVVYNYIPILTLSINNDYYRCFELGGYSNIRIVDKVMSIIYKYYKT